MTAVLDHSRAAVYTAEQQVRFVLDHAHEAPTYDFHGSTLVLPAERRFGSVEAVQAYVDKVLALNWVRTAYRPSALRVRVRKGQARAHYETLTATIAIPPFDRATRSAWAMREIVVLHELAHHLTPMHDHDGTFTAAFVHLVEEIVGPEAGLLLRDAFRQQGVRVGD